MPVPSTWLLLGADLHSFWLTCTRWMNSPVIPAHKHCAGIYTELYSGNSYLELNNICNKGHPCLKQGEGTKITQGSWLGRGRIQYSPQYNELPIFHRCLGGMVFLIGRKHERGCCLYPNQSYQEFWCTFFIILPRRERIKTSWDQELYQSDRMMGYI